MKLKVIQPSRVKIDETIDHVIVPGVDGDFGVSEFHTPFITKIRPGILQVYKNNGIEKYAIHDGFVTVESDQIVIVCETLESENEIDTNRALESKKRAQSRLSESGEDIDFRRAEASLKRALTRLSVKNTVS